MAELLVIPGLALALWQILVMALDVPQWQLPGPWEILTAMVEDFSSLRAHLLTTYGNVLMGFLLAVALGTGLALAIYFSSLVGLTLTPFINIMCVVPVITVVPLLMLWLGFGREAKLIAVVAQSFPVINLNALSAFSNVAGPRLELLRALRASRFQTAIHCLLPSSIPGIFTGVKLAAVLALIAEVTGEISGGDAGLGAQTIKYTQFLKMPQAFACVFYVAAFGAIFYQSLGLIERWLTRDH
jgi:NitT/TauT family transport system permease protein